MRIKKDDTVIVITGKDKGKHGKVLKAMPKENRVVVEGVNVVTQRLQEKPVLKSSISKAQSMLPT